MKNKYGLITLAIVVVLVAGIIVKTVGSDEPVGYSGDRWYSESQFSIGKRVFENNCAVCHGAQGQGLAEGWRQPLADGSYPPPPLNGTAHTWHHPKSQLLRTINDGGVPLGGKMPAFGSLLSDDEKVAVIAYFQNWWPDDIYEGWMERGGLDN